MNLLMRAGLGIFLAAGAALGGEESGTGLSDIPLQEWRDMSLGKTLTYSIDGQFFALERYSTSGDAVMLQLSDGTCYSGSWTHNETSYCYFWEDNPAVCFRHVRAEDEIMILHLDDGVETGEVQTMVGISDTPLVCGGLVS